MGRYWILREESLREGDLYTSYDIHGPFRSRAEAKEYEVDGVEADADGDERVHIFKAASNHRYVAIVIDVSGQMLSVDTAKSRSELADKVWCFDELSYHPHKLTEDELDDLQKWFDREAIGIPKPTTNHTQFLSEHPDDLYVLDLEITRRRIENGKGRREYSELFMFIRKLVLDQK